MTRTSSCAADRMSASTHNARPDPRRSGCGRHLCHQPSACRSAVHGCSLSSPRSRAGKRKARVRGRSRRLPLIAEAAPSRPQLRSARASSPRCLRTPTCCSRPSDRRVRRCALCRHRSRRCAVDEARVGDADDRRVFDPQSERAEHQPAHSEDQPPKLPIDPRGGAMTERLARFLPPPAKLALARKIRSRNIRHRGLGLGRDLASVLLQGKQIVCRGPAILATRCPHSALRRQGKAVAKHLE